MDDGTVVHGSLVGGREEQRGRPRLPLRFTSQVNVLRLCVGLFAQRITALWRRTCGVLFAGVERARWEGMGLN